MSHSPTVRGRVNWLRVARNSSAGLVAGIAGWSSYWHMQAVALGVGEHVTTAYVLPLSVDGLMVVSSIAMVDDRAGGRTPRRSAKVAFAVGILASVAANVAAADPTWLARVVAGWPALALLLTVEVLSRKGKGTPTTNVVAELEASYAMPAAPVSPAPTSTERPMPGSGPVARRSSRSPLTGRTLMDNAPRV